MSNNIKLPERFKRAGSDHDDYPIGSVTVMEIKVTSSGQIIVGIEDWFEGMCKKGDKMAIELLLSFPYVRLRGNFNKFLCCNIVHSK